MLPSLPLPPPCGCGLVGRRREGGGEEESNSQGMGGGLLCCPLPVEEEEEEEGEGLDRIVRHCLPVAVVLGEGEGLGGLGGRACSS